MPTNAGLVQRLRAYPKPLLSDDPELFEHIIAHLERTAALEATPTLEQIKACVADARGSWMRCSSAKEKRVANDMHNQIMESLTALYAQPAPPSDTSAERVRDASDAAALALYAADTKGET